MRNLCYSLVNAVSNASTITSAKIDANQIVSISAVCVQSDTDMAGSVKFQASNDPTLASNLAADFTPTNWVDVPSATATITAGAPAIITIAQNSYRWLRVVVTVGTPGSSTCTVNVNALSI